MNLADPLFYLVFAPILVLFVLDMMRFISGPPTPSSPTTPEDLDQNSAWYRAKKRELEAQAEYETAEAHLKDLRRFLKDNKIGR